MVEFFLFGGSKQFPPGDFFVQNWGKKYWILHDFVWNVNISQEQKTGNLQHGQQSKYDSEETGSTSDVESCGITPPLQRKCDSDGGLNEFDQDQMVYKWLLNLIVGILVKTWL